MAFGTPAARARNEDLERAVPHTVSELSLDAKRAVVAALVAERARRKATFPLSSAQLRMWLIDQHVGAQPIYTVSRAFTLSGALDVAALERSVSEIVGRHSILRTTFHATDGDPMQTIRNSEPFRFQCCDLRHLDDDEQDREVDRVAAQEAEHHFALDADLMIRGLLITTAVDRHVLVFTMHHIAIDEWSLDIFYAELRTLYAAYVAGSEPVLAPIPIAYADYAVWERTHNQSHTVLRQLDYWKEQLTGATPEIALPYERARPERPTNRGASERMLLRGDVVTALAEIARRTGATPYMTYLAAFAVLLHAASGATDLVIGSPISGRRGADTEQLIGFFANSVALRFAIAGERSFLECVEHAKTVALGAFAHRDVPFENVVNAVTSRRNVSANPLFHVAFAMQSAAGFGLSLADITVMPLDQPHRATKFDLAGLFNERRDGVEICFNYSTELFASTTIIALLERFRTVLERVVAEPDRPIRSLGFAAPTAPVAPTTAEVPVRSERGEDAGAVDPMIASIQAQLRDLWEPLLDVRPIADSDDFFALGGHSLLAVRLIARIQDTLGIRLPMAAFFAAPTIAGLARSLVAEAHAPTQTPLALVRRGTLEPPVVVFHGDYTAGGFYFRSIAKHLGDRTIYTLPPHGFDGGEVPESIEAMAAERIALLRREQIEAPFDLVGHCNGALVALEVARQIAAGGASPPRVFVIGSEVYDPAIVRCTDAVALLSRPFQLSERRQTNVVLRLLRWYRDVRVSGPRAIGALIAEEARCIRDRMRRAVAASPVAGAPPTTSPRSLLAEYAQRIVHYRPAPYRGELVVFRPADSARRRAGPEGWARVSPSVDVELVSGDHLSSITTHAHSLAQRLRVRLDR